MKIVLIGYGKMGRAIEEVAIERGHEIVLKLDQHNPEEFTASHLSQGEVAIEFTGPGSAYENLKKCLAANIPVVCGSTGWLDHWAEIEKSFKENGSLIYASNFSIGVNLFFELNKKLASLMSSHPEYKVQLKEIHHTQKRDAPSGTAVSLAEQVMEKIASKTHWVNEDASDPAALSILSERIDPAPGTHFVKYSSPIDDIEIIHTAHNRQGFATGAVLAAEFLPGKKGIFSMSDVLGF